MWDKEKADQAYVIELGVNDIYNENMEIGSIEDIGDENFLLNKPTFVGYYAWINHMNPSGYIFTARLIDSYTDYIVRHNPEDFKNIGFVGTDIKYK